MRFLPVGLCLILRIFSWTLLVKVKDKGRYSSSWGTPSESYETSLAIWDHTEFFLPPDTSERAPPNPSHAGLYSIYLFWRDGRLSWLDSVPAGSWTSDLSITSPTPNHCTTKTAAGTGIWIKHSVTFESRVVRVFYFFLQYERILTYSRCILSYAYPGILVLLTAMAVLMESITDIDAFVMHGAQVDQVFYVEGIEESALMLAVYDFFYKAVHR